MTKVMQTNIQIGGRLNPSLNKAYAAAQKGAKNTASSMQKIGSTAAKVGGLLASAFAVSEIINFGKESVAAFNERIQAETKLKSVMRSRMNASDADIQKILNLTAAQQKLGVVEDDAQTAGLQQLSTFVKQKSSLEKLLPAMNNLAVQQYGVNVTGEKMSAISKGIGKAMMGQTTALSRMGIVLSENQKKLMKYGTEQQKAALMAKIITSKVGSMNAAMANTPTGKMQQLKNTFGDIQENVGGALMNVGVKLIPLISKILPFITKLSDFLVPIIDQLSTALVPIIGQVFDIITPMLPIIMKLVKMILPPIIKITQAVMPLIAALASALMPVVEALMPVIQVLLDLLTPVIVMLVQATTTLVNLLAPALKWVADTISQYLVGAIQVFMPYIQNVINVFTNLINFIKNVFAGNWAAAWDNIKAVFANWIQGLVNLIKIPVNLFINMFNSIIKGINTFKVPDWIPLIGGKGINIPLIPKLAEGGTFSKAMLAVVGEGRYPETLVPHNNSPRSRALLATAAAGVGVGMGGGVTINYTNVINGAAGDISGQLDEGEQKFERMMDAFYAKQRRLSYGN